TQRSRGPLIEIEHPAQALAALHATRRIIGPRPCDDQRIGESLVIALTMIVRHEFRNRAPEMPLAERNQPIQTFFFDRSHESSSAGESHPRAPPEPDVNLPPHTAPTTQPPASRQLPQDKERRVPSRDAPQPVQGRALSTPKTFVFPSHPCSEGHVQMPEHVHTLRPIESAVVVHPAPYLWIDELREVLQALIVDARRQWRIVVRIAVAAFALMAGRKPTKHSCLRFFARRGWKVYPRKSNATFAYFPGRPSLLQWTIRVFRG